MNDQPASQKDPMPGPTPTGSMSNAHAQLVESWHDMRVDIWGPRRCKPRSAGWMG